jgi:hypothetical protein
VLAFGRSAQVAHDAQLDTMSSWWLPPEAPRVLRARRDVLAFGRSARVTHDAQVTVVFQNLLKYVS